MSVEKRDEEFVGQAFQPDAPALRVRLESLTYGESEMPENDWLAEKFQENRPQLRTVACRILGSTGEADDAVQEAWLRLTRSDTSSVENLGGWLTTVVARVCLDMLRSRKSRKEESLEEGRLNEPENPRQ